MPARGLRPAKPTLYPSLGGQVCHWQETLLCHGPGDVQGEPLVWDDEFRRFQWQCYEVYPRDHPWAGRRRYRRAFLSRPKGRAKSELAAADACVEGLGPARFDHWAKRGEADEWGYKFRPGEPVGRAITDAEVLCVATEEGQAGNTYGGVVYMLVNGPIAEEFPGLDVGLTRVNLPGGGVIEPITAAAKSKDGGKSTFIVADEVHLWSDPRLKTLYDTITRNITKRKIANGWLLITSTMFGAGEGSVAEGLYEDAMGGRRDSGLLFDHRQAPDVESIDEASDEELAEALEYVYGAAASWTNIDGIIADELRNPKKSEADNRRYWFNQPWKREAKFVDPVMLAALADKDRKVDPKAPVLLAFDGSRADCTVLLGWVLGDRPHRFTVGIWPRPVNAGPDWRVDRTAVADRVAWAMEWYHVRLMICVPRGWFTEIQGWEALYGDEKLPFVQFDTNTPKRMAEACSRFRVGLSEGIFTHDADPVVDQHLHNCETKASTWGDIVARGPGNEPIDGGVCTIVGFYGLSLVPPEPPKKKVRAISIADAMRRAEERERAGAGGVRT